MPTKQWMQDHKQLKIWITHAEYDQLKQSCADRNITLADALREALAPMVSYPKPPPR